MEWTSDEILKLVSDASLARAGRELASARRWLRLGYDEHACWGECQGSGSVPYLTQIDLGEPAFRCSCPSPRFPCKHALGLFLLYAEQRAELTPGPPPLRVAQWLEDRAKRADRKASTTPKEQPPESRKVRDPSAQAKRASEREARVASGLEELGRWLVDLVRQGLASAQSRPYAFWESAAARMVDAQAPGVARMVRDLAAITASGEGWHERLLERLGRLHLLIEGYSRIATLPEPVQADIRSLIGWTQDQKELLGREGLVDRWLVMGRRIEIEDQLRVQRTWLRGQASGRAALVLHFAVGNQPLDASLVPGTGFDAELVFFPGTWPLRALVKDRAEAIANDPPIGAETTLAAAIAASARARTANPWIELVPLCLGSVIPILRDNRWFIRDAQGDLLSVSLRNDQGWHLLASSGGRPIGLFGEHDGDTLRPLSLWNEQGFVLLAE